MIAVDIGNTTVNFGKFSQNKLLDFFLLQREKVNKKRVVSVLSRFGKKEPVLICSVAPEINSLFLNLNRETYLVGKNLSIPIKSQYAKGQAGSDRLLAAYSARKINPVSRIIIDFGTAITVDFLSKKGIYQGGIILPGINSTLKTFQRCSLLPKQVRIQKTTKIIPKTTLESINKGLQEGFSQMLNGLIEKYKKELKLSSEEAILLTGGDFSPIKSRLNFSYQHEKHLVLRGLAYLYQEYFRF